MHYFTEFKGKRSGKVPVPEHDDMEAYRGMMAAHHTF
jgi:hypothetical protein